MMKHAASHRPAADHAKIDLLHKNTRHSPMPGGKTIENCFEFRPRG
jgi:hypothetical protein